MTLFRSLVVIGALGVLAAAALAVFSRAPASVRLAEATPEATDPSHGASFTDDQIARHGRYRAPSYLSLALSITVEIAVLLLLARGPVVRAFNATREVPGRWVVQAVILAAVVVIVLWVARLPLSYVRGFAMEHAWGLSTQDLVGWLSDKGKGLGVAVVLSAIAAISFFGIVRWQPRWWWLWGWAAFTGLTALLVFVYPVVIAPLFNRFAPLEDASLRAGVVRLAEEAGVEVDDVLVIDASRRTTAENAYVAGLGETKRVVLYDTLIASGSDDETLFVVAHELGHEVHDHVVKGVALASLGLFVGFGALAWLSHRPGIWSWGGATGIGDLRAIPLLLLFATVAGLVLLPAQNALSRRFERQADEVAIALTGDAETAVRSFRRLAFSNIADLRPPDAAVAILYTHPPIPERIESFLEQSGRAP
ncbi:MAG: M48 family metallopeptidase [Actinomycetota bacterium]